MRNYIDYHGLRIRLTDERRAHILEHPEMIELEPKIVEALSQREQVIEIFKRYRGAPLLQVLKRNLGWRQASLRRGEGKADERVYRYCIFDRQGEERETFMAQREVEVWYDKEGDYLEVIFDHQSLTR